VRPDRQWEDIIKYVVVPIGSVDEGYLQDYKLIFETGNIKRGFG
jgi:hypothetical protein